MKAEQIIVLRIFDNLMDANIAKTKLDAYGIPCFLSDENITHLLTPQLSGGIRLHVFREDAESALDIIHSQPVISEIDDLLECPACHSRRIFDNRSDGGSLKPNQIVFRHLMQLTQPYYCLDCELQFT